MLTRRPAATFRMPNRAQADAPAAPLPARIPRLTRLVVLAHRVDAMIRAGEVRDLAEAARLAGVTRARMTQILNLLLLAPDVQAAVLDQQGDRPTERDVRAVTRLPDWGKQSRGWGRMSAGQRTKRKGERHDRGSSGSEGRGGYRRSL